MITITAANDSAFIPFMAQPPYGLACLDFELLQLQHARVSAGIG
jgi:hypothetical protein